MFSELLAEPAVGEALGGQIRSAKGYCCVNVHNCHQRYTAGLYEFQGTNTRPLSTVNLGNY